ncbi:MAG TPA: hypothetical protein VIV60_27690, partial [Polyangiaceae bacterium]
GYFSGFRVLERNPSDTDYVFRVRPANWLHGGAGYEHRWKHFLLRGTLGLAVLLNLGDGTCSGNTTGKEMPCDEAMKRFDERSSGAQTRVLPYGTFAIGYLLD